MSKVVNVDDTWIKQVAALPAEQQVDEVAAKLKELNPGFDGKFTHKIEDGVVTELRIVTDKVTNISPIQVFNGLRVLDLSGTPTAEWRGNGQLSDVTPLKGMKLAGLLELRLNWTKVDDVGLAHFKDCKSLTVLGLQDTKVSDLGLSYFKDCKNLHDLNLWPCQVGDAGLAHFKDVRPDPPWLGRDASEQHGPGSFQKVHKPDATPPERHAGKRRGPGSFR